MALVRFSVGADPELMDALGDCLLSAGAGALEEGPGSLSAYVDSDTLLAALKEAVADFRERVNEALPGLTVEEPEISPVDDDWQDAWLRHLEPEQVTETFTARPTHKADAPKGERTLWLEPSPAFGEGGHASTRLAARAIERLAGKWPGTRLLDVGTGTGILALVGLSSGMSTAVAIDIDPVSVHAATKNMAHNGFASRCEVSSTAIEELTGDFDVVVANMIAPTLTELAPALVARVARGGRLLLSGLLSEDAPALLTTFSALGLREVERDTIGDWCLLELARASD